MGDLVLQRWINEEICLSRNVGSFEVDFANGYLIGELLHRKGLLTSLDGLVDKNSTAAKVDNFKVLLQPLLDLKIKFDSNMATAIMNGDKGIATNLCYQLKIGFDNASAGGEPRRSRLTRSGSGGLPGASVKSNRQPLAKYQAMQSNHFDTMVKKASQDPKELAEALAVSRFTEFMVAETHQMEDDEALATEQKLAAVSQRRELQLTKMRESKQLMDEWQAEGYANQRKNLARRAATERSALRFEKTQLERKLHRVANANARSAAEQVEGIDDFEKSLKRLANDTSAEGGTQEGSPLVNMDVAPDEHLARLEKQLPSSKAMEAEVQTYMERLRSKKVEEDASRKEREMRRRKVMLEQATAQAALEDRRREEMLLSKLSRQCEEEKRIAEQLWKAQKEKAVMKENREFRERQYEERRAQDQKERLARERELGARSRAEYQQHVALERQRSEEAAEKEKKARAAKTEGFCRGVVERLLGVSQRVTEFRSTTEQLLPPKVFREWLSLFSEGVPLEDDPVSSGTDAPPEGAAAEGYGDAPAADSPEPASAAILHDKELDDYLNSRSDWATDLLAEAPLPKEQTGAGLLLEPSCVVPTEVEQGCSITGRMVLELIEVALPPPPPASPVPLPASMLKLAVLGKSFSGKSLRSQQLADHFNLCVVLPNEVLQMAIATAIQTPLVGEDGNELVPSAEEAASSTDPALLGMRAAASVRDGGVVSDEVLVNLVVAAVRAIDSAAFKGFVLDGFPRTATQAKLLEKALTGYSPAEKEAAKPKGSKVAPPPAEQGEAAAEEHVPGLDLVLRLDISDETARKRALGRRHDPQTGNTYHLEFQPPPEEPGLHERLVTIADDSNQQAQLQPALASYADAEAPLAEWLGHLKVLCEFDGSSDSIASELTDTVDATVSAKERAAAQAAEATKAAEAKAAEEKAAEEAAAAEAKAAAEAAAAAAAEGGYEQSAEGEAEGAAPVEWSPPVLAEEVATEVLAQWREIETGFVGHVKKALQQLRELQWQGLTRVAVSRSDYAAVLSGVDTRQEVVLAAQQKFNAMPTPLRFDECGKAELHMVVEEMQDAVYTLSDQKRIAAEKRLVDLSTDGWLAQQALLYVLAILELCQAEIDRFIGTCAVLQLFASVRCGKQLPLPPPGLADASAGPLPVPEAVVLAVPPPDFSARSGSSATPAPPAKEEKGKAPPKGKVEEPTPADAALIAAVESAIKTHCESPPPAETPPATEDAPPPTPAEALVAEWTTELARAINGERAKLQRRLCALGRYGCTVLEDQRAQAERLQEQLDEWLGLRLKNESSALSELVKLMRRAAEEELPLPQSLALEGDELHIDESLLLLPPPPPPPVPPPAQPASEECFSIVQLESLAGKLRAAAAGTLISADTLASLLTRAGAGSFDAALPPLPAAWRPLGASAFAKLAALYCPPESKQLAWPEVMVSLAAVSLPSALQCAKTLEAAAIKVADASSAPASAPPAEGYEAGGEGGAEGGAEDNETAEAAAAPTAPPTMLTRAQYDSLPLWFEKGMAGGAGEYPTAAKLKALFFEIFARPAAGEERLIDMQEFLLFFCEHNANAFAVLGFTQQQMLTLPQLYRFFHRDAPAGAEQLPDYVDRFSLEVLKRLFNELHLTSQGEDARVSYQMMRENPFGQALLEACELYKPKKPYGLVKELRVAAGPSLSM